MTKSLSHPSYGGVELCGSPETVARLMAALAGVGEVIFDHRSAPDARGEVTCRAQVVTYQATEPLPGPARVDAVVQSTLRLDAPWSDLSGSEYVGRLEADATSALAAVEGVREVTGSRLVAVIPSTAT
ncbi:hypothetical protein [Streptomyces sp. NPDC059783]|uniref:hypothetical protein n=1 Tax=Streptomyces sp. NPDC059783 TaxID=3346944 RepID=UPI00364A913B